MTNLALFKFNSNEIRFINGEPVANDVAAALGYADPSDAVYRIVKPKNKGVCKLQTPGGIQSVAVLKEAGIYQLIFKSKLSAAEQFQDWVFEEVLPSIRKTGTYSLKEQDSPEWKNTRKKGKVTRRLWTDSIKFYIDNHPELSDNAKRFIYINASNELNRQLFGKSAKQLVELIGCDPDELRDHFSAEEVSAIWAIEEFACYMMRQLDLHPVKAIKEACARTMYQGRFAKMYLNSAQPLEITA